MQLNNITSSVVYGSKQIEWILGISKMLDGSSFTKKRTDCMKKTNCIIPQHHLTSS
jgi:hypothetical protein